tara:strand:- start:80 stop:262 length:183 start_codon:yes stop_codon:yes gene_type:complete
MHEVKVYDSSGKLKKVISSQTLNIRSKQQLETPEMFLRNKRGRKPSSKSTNKSQTEAETS